MSKDTQDCPICGEPVDAEADFRAYKGFVAYYIEGKAGILHRHNLANWSSAREEHPTPTEKRKQRTNGSKPAMAHPDVDAIMQELGTDTAIDRLLVQQSLAGSSKALGEILGRVGAGAEGERYAEFRKNKAMCPTCSLWPVPTVSLHLDTAVSIAGIHNPELTWRRDIREEVDDAALLALGRKVASILVAPIGWRSPELDEPDEPAGRLP